MIPFDLYALYAQKSTLHGCDDHAAFATVGNAIRASSFYALSMASHLHHLHSTGQLINSYGDRCDRRDCNSIY